MTKEPADGGELPPIKNRPAGAGRMRLGPNDSGSSFPAEAALLTTGPYSYLAADVTGAVLFELIAVGRTSTGV